MDWFQKIRFKTAQFDAQENNSLQNFSQKELLANIYSTNSSGKVFLGVDTYIQVCKRIFFLFPFYIILSLPGIYQITQKIYRYVAQNRETE